MSTTDQPYAEQAPAAREAADFDPQQVAVAARHQDPGLPPETAALLAGQAYEQLRKIGELDAPALARALMAANEGVGATPCNAVATASVAHCRALGLLSG